MSEARPAAPEPELGDDTVLWRRVHPDLVKRSGSDARPMSGVFLDPDDEMSLHRRSETDLETVRAAYPGFGVVEVTAGQLRSVANLDVVIDELEDDPSHALARGKVTRGQAKQLAREATWVVEPEPRGESS